MLAAAQLNNGVAQVITGQLIYFLAPSLGTLRNEGQANHIILTLNGIHPKLHEVDTSTTNYQLRRHSAETPNQWRLSKENWLASRPKRN
jgi:hypothetical protein